MNWDNMRKHPSMCMMCRKSSHCQSGPFIAPRSNKEEYVALGDNVHPLGVYGLSHDHIKTDIVHVGDLVRGGLKLGAEAYGDMRVSVVIFHVCPSFDLVHFLKEIVL